MVVVGPVVAAVENQPDIINILDGFASVDETKLAALQRSGYLNPDASFAGDVASVARALQMLTMTPAMLPRRFEVTVVAIDKASALPNTWAVNCPDYSLAPFALQLPLAALLQRDSNALQPLVQKFNNALKDDWSVTSEDLLLGFDTGLVKPSQPLLQAAPSIVANDHIIVSLTVENDRAFVADCPTAMKQFFGLLEGTPLGPRDFVNFFGGVPISLSGKNQLMLLTASVNSNKLGDFIWEDLPDTIINVVLPLKWTDELADTFDKPNTATDLQKHENYTGFYDGGFNTLVREDDKALFKTLYDVAIMSDNAKLYHHTEFDDTEIQDRVAWDSAFA